MKVLKSAPLASALLIIAGASFGTSAFATHTNVGPYESEEMCWNLGVSACVANAEDTCKSIAPYGGKIDIVGSLQRTECAQSEDGTFYMHCYFRCVTRQQGLKPGVILHGTDDYSFSR